MAPLQPFHNVHVAFKSVPPSVPRLFQTGKFQRAKPQPDFRGLCGECHAMFHRMPPTLSPTVLPSLLHVSSSSPQSVSASCSCQSEPALPWSVKSGGAPHHDAAAGPARRGLVSNKSDVYNFLINAMISFHDFGYSVAVDAHAPLYSSVGTLNNTLLHESIGSLRRIRPQAS